MNRHAALRDRTMDMHDPCDARTLDQVLSMVVHKFGNSLNSHNMTLEVLIRHYEEFEDRKKIHFLERALQETRRQQCLLLALKAYSGLNVGAVRPVPFRMFWQQFQPTLESRFNGAPIWFESRQDIGDIPVDMEIQALSKALHLLLDNAVDAAGDLEQPRISLTASIARHGEHRAVIRVADNGPGIPDQVMANVFTPLFSTRRDHFGLGLPLARKIAREMAGGLCLVKGEGQGITAELWLKAGQAPDTLPGTTTGEDPS